MLIECHEFVTRGITQTLKKRFSESHDIEDIVEGPRDPNQFVGLRNWRSVDRWLAVNEGRPLTMNWLVCWARSDHYGLRPQAYKSGGPAGTG